MNDAQKPDVSPVSKPQQQKVDMLEAMDNEVKENLNDAPQPRRIKNDDESDAVGRNKLMDAFVAFKTNALKAKEAVSTEAAKFDEKYKVSEKPGKWKTWTCRTMVRRPLAHCGAYWGVMILLLIIITVGGYLSIAQITLTDFQIREELDVQRDFALTAGRNLVKESGSLSSTLRFRNENLTPFSIFFLYEAVGNAPLLSPENLQAICNSEAAFLNNSEYQFFCPTSDPQGKDTQCDQQQGSVSSIFYNAPGVECTKLDKDFIAQRFAAIQGTTLAERLFNDATNPTVARSTAFLAGPLGKDSPPFKDFTETESLFLEPQAEEGYKIFTQAFKSAIVSFVGAPDQLFNQPFDRKFFSPPGSVGLHLRTDGPQLEFLEFQNIVLIDSFISAGSFVVVTSLVWMYTGSLFFSFFAMLGVALSVVVGLFLYAIVFQIDYFNNLHIVVLFIIMAIGANNIFVLFDAWKQSEAVILEEMAAERLKKEQEADAKFSKEAAAYNPMFEGDEDDVDLNDEETLIRRLNYAYSRAAQSVSNTALTTFIAFFATFSSPLAPIAAFGFFAGLVILVNLFYMLNIHPAVLMVYHIYIVIPHQQKKKEKDELEAIGRSGMIEMQQEQEKKKWIGLDELFENYIYLVNKTLFPIISLVCTVSFGIMMFVFALKLETPTQVESNFGDDHMFTGFGDAFNAPFTEGNDETFSQCTAVFGIAGLDDSGVARFTTDSFKGSPIFDESFTILTEESQDFIKSVCDEVEERLCDEEGCLEPTLFLNRTLNCWIRDFQEYFLEETGSSKSFVIGNDGKETGLTDEDFIEHIRAFVEDGSGSEFKRDIGMIGEEIKFVTLRYRKSMKEDQPLKIKQPVIEQIKEMTNEFKEKAPIGMQTFYQTSFDFVWQHTEEGLVSGLYSGMAISLVACLVVVFLGTGNLLVSVFAILVVGTIVFCVLGSIQTMGWELGSAEALAGVMVIGLAVDYTVHLGHMFVQSYKFLSEHDIGDLKKESEFMTMHKSIVLSKRFAVSVEMKENIVKERVVFNEDMVRYAVDRMGVTILAGAFTTFCSGAFLLLCTLAFFSKMAILIILTVVYSTIFAFCMFVPLLRIFGPGARGDKFEGAAQVGAVKKISV